MRGLVLWMAALPLVAADLPVAQCAAGPPEAVVIVVRHADRDGELLNKKGWERARLLRELIMGRFGRVDAVVTTTIERTLQTVTPLLEAVKERGGEVAVRRFDPHDYEAAARAIEEARRRSRQRPAVIVYAGHSDTVRPILERLAPEQVREHAAEWFPCGGGICHSDYDNVWAITYCPGAAPAASRSEFGRATPAH